MSNCKHLLNRQCRYCGRSKFENAALRAELETVKGAMRADDERLVAAALKAGIAPGGCDTPDDLADEICALREELKTTQKELAGSTAKSGDSFQSELIGGGVERHAAASLTNVLAGNARRGT